MIRFGETNKIFYLETGKKYGGDLLVNLGWHFINDFENKSLIKVFKKQ